MLELNEQVIWSLLVQKFPHSEWCELVTGLWHECDCGASEKRLELYRRYLNKRKKGS